VVDNFSGIFYSVCSDFKNPFQTKVAELESTSSFWQNQTDKETIYRRAKEKFTSFKVNWTKFKYKNHKWLHEYCRFKELFSKMNAVSCETVPLRGKKILHPSVEKNAHSA
jgi:hypothetical protein